VGPAVARRLPGASNARSPGGRRPASHHPWLPLALLCCVIPKCSAKDYSTSSRSFRTPRRRPPERGGRPLLPCLQSGTLPAAGGTWWKTQGVCHQRRVRLRGKRHWCSAKQLGSELALRTVPRQDVVPTTACRSPPRRGARDLGPRRSAGFRLPARAWSPPRGGSRLPHARRPRVFSSPAAAEPGSPADLSPTESVRGT
jgi:hypothetical protein